MIRVNGNVRHSGWLTIKQSQEMLEENNVKTNSFRAWLLAARPKTLTGAAVPVMIGAALTIADHGWQIGWLPCVLCFLFAFIMQIDANFVNDYFDFVRGNDDAATRLGPLRACSMGWVTASAMRRALVITTALGCAVGLPLVVFGGFEMILVGAVCVLFCFLYTTKLSYLGLGDLLVLVFFGIVPVCLTYYLCLPEESSRTVTLSVFLSSLACGFVIDTLLLINNNRDIDNDRRDGKMTLVVRVGHRGGEMLYLLSGVVALLLNMVFIVEGHFWAFLLPLIVYLPLHTLAFTHLLKIDHGRELNKVLGETARNMFLFGVTTSVGLIL